MIRAITETYKRHKLSIFIFGLFAIALLWDIILLKKSFLFGDYRLQFFPWYMEYSDALKHWRLPFWSSSMGCGFPLLAEGQTGCLYPLNLAMFFLLPPVAAYNLSIALHFILGGFFMYLFCRELGMEEIPSLLGAILFSFSSPYAGCFSTIASLKTLCWMPFVFYLILHSAKSRKPVFLIISGIVMGMQFLAGAVQMAIYAFLAACAYFIYCLFTGVPSGKERVRQGVFFLIACVICGLMFVPQFMASARLAALSNRPGQGLDFAMWNSLLPPGVLTLVFPSLAGVFRAMLYIGIIPLLFCVYCLSGLKKNQMVFFLAFFFITLCMAFGRFNPLYVLLIKWLKLYSLRTPSKLLFFSGFSLIILSCAGLQGMLESLRRGGKISVKKPAFLAAFFLLVWGIGFAVSRFPGLLPDLGRRFMERYIIGMPFHRHSPEYYFAKLDSFCKLITDSFSFSNIGMAVQLVLLTCGFILIFLLSRKKIRAGAFLVLSAVVLFCDLLFFSLIGTGFRGNLLEIKQACVTSPVIEFLRKDKSLFRVYVLPEGDFPEPLLQANSNLLFSIGNVGIYSPLVYKEYYGLLLGLGCVDDSLGMLYANPGDLGRSMGLLSRLNVKYVISRVPLDVQGLKSVFSDGKVTVYENTAALPRVFFAGEIKYTDESTIRKLMCSPDYTLSPRVMVDSPGRQEVLFAGKGMYKAEISSYANERVIVRTSATSARFLVLNDYFYPGWKAYIDQRPVKLYKVDLIFRGVDVPAGDHKVEFRYERPLF